MKLVGRRSRRLPARTEDRSEAVCPLASDSRMTALPGRRRSLLFGGLHRDRAYAGDASPTRGRAPSKASAATTSLNHPHVRANRVNACAGEDHLLVAGGAINRCNAVSPPNRGSCQMWFRAGPVNALCAAQIAASAISNPRRGVPFKTAYERLRQAATGRDAMTIADHCRHICTAPTLTRLDVPPTQNARSTAR